MAVFDSITTWAQEPINVLILAMCVMAVAWLAMRLLRKRRRSYPIHIRDPKQVHRWQSAEFIDKPTYCNACMEICLCGSSCESCGLCICVEGRCLKMASSAHSCKPLSDQHGEKPPHFWVRGNLPLTSLCFKCLTPCGNLPKLVDLKCVWCQKTTHEDCVKDSESETDCCSLGPHQTMIIPPSSVTAKLEGWRGRRKLVVKSITPPAIDHWRPLVVLANPNSGAKDAEIVLATFRKLLNPIQVVDLSESPPEAGLEICRLLPEHTCRVLVCGGDGTVGWVLAAIDRCKLPTPPHVGILPLGTGNDLARVLGWGKGYSNEEVSELLREVEHSQLCMLDRWEVRIEHRRYLGLKRGAKVIDKLRRSMSSLLLPSQQRAPDKVLTMNNYMGVGCDASVTLNFHRQRQSRPELFPSRIINKFWYIAFGARDVIEQSCQNVQRKFELYFDGVLQKLPQLEGIILLNINSWSAGCSMWSDVSNDQFHPSRMNDQQLEVVGLYSSFHVGKIQVHLAEPLRLGQASEIKIVVRESIPMHIDGEPWQQGCATVTISHLGQAHMLRKVEE